jgi:hypothetical protein
MQQITGLAKFIIVLECCVIFGDLTFFVPRSIGPLSLLDSDSVESAQVSASMQLLVLRTWTWKAEGLRGCYDARFTS